MTKKTAERGMSLSAESPKTSMPRPPKILKIRQEMGNTVRSNFGKCLKSEKLQKIEQRERKKPIYRPSPKSWDLAFWAEVPGARNFRAPKTKPRKPNGQRPKPPAPDMRPEQRTACAGRPRPGHVAHSRSTWQVAPAIGRAPRGLHSSEAHVRPTAPPV